MIPLERVRGELPITARAVYLNTGTLGPSPRPVTEAYVRAYRAWQRSGPGDPQRYRAARQAVEPCRERLARLLGVPASCLALSANSTDGINLVAHGFDWSPGDEVVVTDQEHLANLAVWLNLARRRGIVVRVAAAAPDAAAAIARWLGPRTRLISVSHVSCQTGEVLPVAAICRLGREAGVPVLLDGAQAVGQVPVDLGSLEPDFYALNGHKWLLGPVGTGALYIAPHRLGTLEPSWTGDGAVDKHNSNRAELCFHPSARRHEFGTRNWPLWQGLAAAVDYLEALGWESVLERTRRLAAALRKALEQVPDIEVLGSGGSGMVSARPVPPPGPDWPEQACLWLRRRHRLVCRPVRELGAVRFATAFFNTEEETALAARAMAELAATRRRRFQSPSTGSSAAGSTRKARRSAWQR